MKGKLLQPVVFNAITIVAMLLALSQLALGAPGRVTRTAEAIQLLEQLAEEGALVDETLVTGLEADRAWRVQFANNVIVTMVIAILANIAANFLGRGRHHTNTSRIRELEAELRGLRGG